MGGFARKDLFEGLSSIDEDAIGEGTAEVVRLKRRRGSRRSEVCDESVARKLARRRVRSSESGGGMKCVDKQETRKVDWKSWRGKQ